MKDYMKKEERMSFDLFDISKEIIWCCAFVSCWLLSIFILLK